MGRTVIAEVNLLPYLIHLVEPDSYVVGLVLGQNVGQRDYVVHLARTPHPAPKDVKDESAGDAAQSLSKVEHLKPLKSVQDIQETLVVDHAEHVTRMLPGGMWVLGIFIVGPGDVFQDAKAVSKLRTVLHCIKKNLSNKFFLHGNSPSSEKLALHLCSTTQRYTCKSFDTNNFNSSVYPVEWKFQPKATRWHQIDCHYNLDQVFPTSLDKQTQSLKKNLQDMLAAVCDNIKSAICMFDGELKDSSEVLDAFGKKKKSKASSRGNNTGEVKTLNVSLYIPCDTRTEKASEMQIIECSGEMKFFGSLASRVFLHQKATVQEAERAVKQDIVRSLASRLELHWDSLIEEENGSPEEHLTLHEPPRRVLVSLPGSRVTLSDYLFPGEGPSEALISLQELLDVEVEESDVQKDLEVQADPADFYALDPQLEGDASEDILPVTVNTHNILFIGLAIAALILAVSVASQLTSFIDKTE
ncbi:odr-4-like protein [Cryptotermes secundus]|uniref:Odr-4-like protein n=2 Tax=Cryptotermes secundus TaxID=105785 RepID=A0A2J7PFC0_9NEOP|nr:protein odr-4 homolog [Cryptotermes secundus]PNF15033.1 odr-4-like protein [Cryptotermes secundus]